MRFSSDTEEYKRMTEKPVFGLVMGLSIPTVLVMLITSIYNMADTYFVSSLGNSATSAVGVVFSIQSIIQAIGYGFGMGSQSLVSRKLGEKKKEEAEMYATCGFLASVVMGVFLMILGLINPAFCMRLFGSTETALPYACEYGVIILIGAPVFCSSFVLNNILRAEGKATLSMIGMCSGGLINIALDAYFIRGLELGVKGAALATVISQAISFLILATFFLSGKTIVKIHLFHPNGTVSDCVTVFRTGLPTVFRQSLGSVATTLLNHAVNPFGDEAFAAVSIANKVYMLLRGMIIGVGQGFQPVAGYNFGAGKNSRVRKAFHAAILIGTAYGLIAAIILFFRANEIIALFRPDDVEVCEIGGRMLRYLSISLAGLGYSTFVNQLYQSLGFVVPATVLASLRQGIFFIPLVLLLPRFFGLTGIEITQSLSDILTFVASIPFHVVAYQKIIPLEQGTSSFRE